MREHLSKGLGFSKEDRDTNIRRIGWVAKVLARNGVVAVTAAISPYRELRDEMRSWIDNFIEIYIATPFEVCEDRDVKGLYAKARAGDIPQFTGLNDPYEPPLEPRDPGRDRRPHAGGVGRGRRRLARGQPLRRGSRAQPTPMTADPVGRAPPEHTTACDGRSRPVRTESRHRVRR